MKKLMVLLTVVLLAACGGGSSTDTTADDTSPDVSTPDTLPDIVDLYDDGVFKYADPELYEGTYKTVVNSEIDTCSNFFGENMPETAQVASLSTTGMIAVIDNTQASFPYVSQDMSDAYLYDGSYAGVYCGFAVSSQNLDTASATVDQVMLYCALVDGYASCTTRYLRNSAYDFTSREIKSGDITPLDAIKGMME